MAPRSLRSSLRTVVAVGAFGALAVFGTAATAGAQPLTPPDITGPDFGSLGSLTAIFLPGANDNFGGSLADNLGSLSGMAGSATGSLDSDSVGNMRETLVAGSSQGSLGSIGQLAGQTNPDAIPGSVDGSAEGSNEGSTMLTGVDSGSITGMLDSASLGLDDALNPDTEPPVVP